MRWDEMRGHVELCIEVNQQAYYKMRSWEVRGQRSCWTPRPCSKTSHVIVTTLSRIEPSTCGSDVLMSHSKLLNPVIYRTQVSNLLPVSVRVDLEWDPGFVDSMLTQWCVIQMQSNKMWHFIPIWRMTISSGLYYIIIILYASCDIMVHNAVMKFAKIFYLFGQFWCSITLECLDCQSAA